MPGLSLARQEAVMRDFVRQRQASVKRSLQSFHRWARCIN